MENVPKNVAASAQAIALHPRRATAEDEHELVRLAQNGTEAAFEQLVRRHQQRVFAVVSSILRRREDVEDVAQQVFIKAYISLKKFDLRSAFATWLYKITVNECWDYLRKKRVRPLVYEADLTEEQVQKLESFAGAGNSPASPSERALLGDLVERLLSRLTEEDRQILVLKEVEGLSVEEVAQMTGLNVNTVKVRLFRARVRLAEVYRRQTGSTRTAMKRTKGGADGHGR